MGSTWIFMTLEENFYAKKLFITWILILLCVTIFYFIPSQNKKVKAEFDLFYFSRLSGKIIKNEEYSRGANFTLNNSQVEYSFYPYVDKQLNNAEIFQYLAKPGDSIFKESNSDTLLLIKKNKTYAYTFKKM